MSATSELDALIEETAERMADGDWLGTSASARALLARFAEDVLSLQRRPNDDLAIIDQAIDRAVDVMAGPHVSPEANEEAMIDVGQAMQAEIMRRYSRRLFESMMAKFRSNFGPSVN